MVALWLLQLGSYRGIGVACSGASSARCRRRCRMQRGVVDSLSSSLLLQPLDPWIPGSHASKARAGEDGIETRSSDGIILRVPATGPNFPDSHTEKKVEKLGQPSAEKGGISGGNKTERGWRRSGRRQDGKAICEAVGVGVHGNVGRGWALAKKITGERVCVCGEREWGDPKKPNQTNTKKPSEPITPEPEFKISTINNHSRYSCMVFSPKACPANDETLACPSRCCHIASHLAAKHSECSNLPPLGLAEMSSMPIQCLDAIAGP
ncbi:hypothetical protein EDB85DRAFT_1896107 [Lactarius pseudohatsudake]|nr:hypothetical protein EDB85DRAFT_1896107 [Lactarius pseudohatsudake]